MFPSRLAAALCAARLLGALDPSLAISQYAARHWQVEDGLPQNYVTSIARSADGYLLVGTSGGVVKFDGVRFTPLVLDARTGLMREWINAAQAAPDGSIWIASRDAGLFRYRGGKTSSIGGGRGGFQSLMVTRTGELAGVGNGSLWRWSAEPRETLANRLAVEDLNWCGLAESEGALWVATSEGVVRVQGGSARVAVKREALGAPAYSLAPARAGGLWVGTGAGLALVERGVVPVAGVPGPVVSIVEDRDGVVWAATWGRGLYRVTARGVSAWTARDGLPDDFVHALYEDDEGSLWIGSRAGLSRWKSGPIVPYGPPEGLTGNYFSAVTGDRRGNLWLGTWRSGLYRFRDGAMSKVPLDAPELKVLVRAMAVSPQGALWFAGWNSGLSQATPAGWKHYARRVQALAFDTAGALWLGTDTTLYRYPSGEPAPGLPAVMQGRAVQALLATRDGRMWAGTASGLWIVEGQRVTAVAGLPHPSVTSLSQDGQGRVWATTRANGVTLVAPSGSRTFAEREGLPPLPFYAVLDDGAGSLWLSSPAGIFEVPLAHVAELLAGRRGALEPVAYTQDDGMRTIECQNVGHPSGWKDSAGDLWFPTVRGAVRVRPRLKRTPPPPAVVVESVAFSAQAHTVRFTAPRLSSPARLEFRYRIEGLNAGWISAGADRDLRYDHLPAGRHTLLVAARERGGEWGPPAQVTLEQPPRVHETWWFRLLALGAVAGILYLVHRWRAHLLKSRFALVLAERNRIAREWHDTLLAGFSAISWQLDATLKRLTEKPETAAETVQVARTMVQHYRAEARRVIWDLRRDEPEPESLACAVSAVLAELTRDHGVSAKVEVEGDPVQLPGEITQNLLRICQEAATNAILHGSPSSIEVRLRFGGGQVTAAIHDDGAGFDPERVPAGHFGLEIMRERARRCRGDLHVSSRPGGGTIVTAAVPLPAAAK